jgi:zinc transport system permease protein
MLDLWWAAGSSVLARNALLMAVLASVACGVVGTYVVTRRISYIAAGVAHCVLAGLGAARYLNVVHGWTFLQPIHGAIVAALLAAAIIGWVSLRTREREDTAIGAVWSVGMALGILFIYRTPGYNQDLMSYLFGDILLVSRQYLWLTLLLDGVIVAVVLLFHRQLQAVCFDEEFARLRNLRTDLYYLLLLALTALTVVLLSMVVGIVLVIALLTLPAAIASRFSASLTQMMVYACAICAGFNLLGLTVSYKPDLPAGPTIILLLGLAYLILATITTIRARRRG